jgi:hypothetical protein
MTARVLLTSIHLNLGERAMAVEREVLIHTSADATEGMKISWGGVFGGVLAGVGTLILLSSLGIAVGISAVDPRNPDAGAIGTGAAIWAAAALLISLFVAGWASTRLSLLWERTTAVFEGVLVWVLSVVLLLYLAANGVSLMVSGATGLIGEAAQATSGAMGGGAVNEAIAGATGGDPAQSGAELRQRAEELASRARANLPNAAAEAQPEATTTAWVTFVALVLSLAAAIAGAAFGRRRVAAADRTLTQEVTR